LLLISEVIFDLQGLKAPKNLDKIAASLKSKHGDLLPGGEFQLSSGMCISIEDLQNTLQAHTGAQFNPPEIKGKKSDLESDLLDIHLDRLFSPKQKELVLKKREGMAFTKTEREYYSRIVRKKLAAIASEKLGKLARSLIGS